jgi:hypothetical protein
MLSVAYAECRKQNHHYSGCVILNVVVSNVNMPRVMARSNAVSSKTCNVMVQEN